MLLETSFWRPGIPCIFFRLLWCALRGHLMLFYTRFLYLHCKTAVTLIFQTFVSQTAIKIMIQTKIICHDFFIYFFKSNFNCAFSQHGAITLSHVVTTQKRLLQTFFFVSRPAVKSSHTLTFYASFSDFCPYQLTGSIILYLRVSLFIFSRSVAQWASFSRLFFCVLVKLCASEYIYTVMCKYSIFLGLINVSSRSSFSL